MLLTEAILALLWVISRYHARQSLALKVLHESPHSLDTAWYWLN